MKNVVEPQQWTTICTVGAPVSSRTLATLQNTDALAGARHSGRGDPASVAGTARYDRVVILDVFDRR